MKIERTKTERDTMKENAVEENADFLASQIITYLGNKRNLLDNIREEIIPIQKTLGGAPLVAADLFSGSGIVARMLKQFSRKIITNDLEEYSFVLNDCYLTNKGDFPKKEYSECRKEIESGIQEYLADLNAGKKSPGIIASNYAPLDDNNIRAGERAFYTRENALLIDGYRALIDKAASPEIQKFFLAPLLTEASVHVNTSGVFKGFYKDKNSGIGKFGGAGREALTRILGRISLPVPVLSNFECERELCKEDAVALSEKLRGLDMAYLDPPYNQHPYGSNYFMLNLILRNKLDVPISSVSGITQDWKRSDFNKAAKAFSSMEKIVAALDAKYVIVSYNSEGFIKFAQMEGMLKKYGSVKTKEIKYNAFRGSRNLHKRDIHVKEYIFVLKKN